MIDVVITGLDRIQQMLDPGAFDAALSRGMERAAEAIRDDVKRMPPVSKASTGFGAHGIPVDTGRMRQSIQKRKLALLSMEIYADTNYSRFVHDGTGKMPPRPFFEWELTDFGGSSKIAAIISESLSRLFG
jgi:HK97 gp10 family phage protein